MVLSRVFIFIAVTLCFVACLCAQATVNKEEAIKLVNAAKRSIVKALKIAEYELKEAKNVKRDMEWYEEKAKKRVSEADAAAAAAEVALEAAKQSNAKSTLTAAQKIKANQALEAAKQRKSQAENVATNQKRKLQNALDAYPNVTNDANTAIQFLSNLLLTARKLDQKAESAVLLETNSQDDYTAVSETALSVKTEAEALERKIENAKKLLHAAKAIIHRMPAPTTEEQIAKYKADGFSAGFVLDTIVGEADSIVHSIEFYKNQVNMSVETIKKILKINPQKLSPRINRFLTTAQDDLVQISQRVNEIYKSKQSIMKWKKHAEDYKEILHGTNDETIAKRRLQFINFYAENSASELERMKETLKAAKKSFRSAYNQRKSASGVYFEHEDALNSEVNAATEKPEKIVKDTQIILTRQEAKRQTDQKKESTAEKEAIISTSKNEEVHTIKDSEKYAEDDTEVPQTEATVELMMRSRKETITVTSQNSAHQESGQREMEKVLQPKDKTSEILNLDKLRKSKKNITKVSLVDGNVSATSAWGDGSMFVSVPLMSALIASAVLH